MSKNLNSSHELDASTIIKEICKRIDGGGGGQQNFASGSGKFNIDSDELKDICKKYLWFSRERFKYLINKVVY